MDSKTKYDLAVGNFSVDDLKIIAKPPIFRVFWCAPYLGN